MVSSESNLEKGICENKLKKIVEGVVGDRILYRVGKTGQGLGATRWGGVVGGNQIDDNRG